jgi:nitronate monooxygenase
LYRKQLIYQPRHHEAALARLREIYTAYGVDFSEAAAQAQSDFLDQVRVLIEEKTPVVSFTFGIPEKPVIEKLRDAGCKLIGTATCVGEAELLAEAGFDAIVAQGFEAGGHRCTFGSTLQESKEIPNIGLFAFVPQIVARVRVPVIAAGAIMDGKGIVAALTLGAAGCQLGTAFMGCPETALTASWRKALVNSDDVSTSLTKTFSGRFARGIQNRFMDEMEAVKENLPPFPIQNTLTRALRSEAKRRDDAGYQSLWSGQAARLIRSLPAEKLMQSLVEEMRAAVEEVTYFDSRE